jgi:hypothetical protein
MRPTWEGAVILIYLKSPNSKTPAPRELAVLVLHKDKFSLCVPHLQPYIPLKIWKCGQ